MHHAHVSKFLLRKSKILQNFDRVITVAGSKWEVFKVREACDALFFAFSNSCDSLSRSSKVVLLLENLESKSLFCYFLTSPPLIR